MEKLNEGLRWCAVSTRVGEGSGKGENTHRNQSNSLSSSGPISFSALGSRRQTRSRGMPCSSMSSRTDFVSALNWSGLPPRATTCSAVGGWHGQNGVGRALTRRGGVRTEGRDRVGRERGEEDLGGVSDLEHLAVLESDPVGEGGVCVVLLHVL